MVTDLFFTGLSQGLILSLISLGIMMTFRILNFSDLSAEGAYPLGGAVCSILLVAGLPNFLTVIVGMFSGGLMALCTAQLSSRFKIDSLLAGIVLSMMIYSLNLRIMGKPNLALFELDIESITLYFLGAIVFVCVFLMNLFFKTEYGLRLRAVGYNQRFSKIYNICERRYMSLGLFIAGSLFGLAGSIMVQIQQFMDVGMGVGIAIHGLASLMIGEVMVGKDSLHRQLIAPVVGALFYQQIHGVVLFLGLAPSDLKFFTGAVVLIALIFQQRFNHR